MDSKAVLVKTDKGAEELAQRTGAVPQKLRAILIMVDGKSQFGELQDRYFTLPDFSEHLLWLVDNGFVRALGAAVGQVAPAPIATGSKGRAGLIELAQQLLGDHGKSVIQRLQDTEDVPEALMQTLERCCKLIRLSIDESKAEQFRAQGIKLLA